ncbi:MAG TPA: hypothetical protein VH815_07590 [Acidobacteriota bacterium]
MAFHDYARNKGLDRFIEMSSRYSGISFFAYLQQLKRQIALRQFQRIKDLFHHFFFKSKVL